MDFKSMKRKELQALCKKHGLPANATNSQMIENLSSILQENLKPKGCLKGSGGSSVEDLGFIRGGSKKVTFSFQDEEDGDEEFTMNSARKTRRKSVGRRSVVASELEKGSKEIEKGGHCESAKNVPEVPRRATRSRGLAESVIWSPVIEKRRGARGVRRNADVSLDEEEKPVVDEKPSSRSLRSKVVVVGGDKESVAHQGRRNTRKSKSIDKKEENEEVAVSLKEENDNAVGKKNLRKRSREGDDAEDEPPPRRPTRSHAKLEESVDIAEVDAGRSKKRRRVIEALAVKADEDIEKVSETGGTPKRLRGKMSKSNVIDSGHTNDAAGLKKATDQGKMNQEIRTESMLDSKAVTGPTRRLTRSSVALLEVENSVFAVGKSDMEPKTVRRRKSEKQTKGRYAAASLLTDKKVVAEPVRRSTRSTSTSLEDDSSLLVAEKLVKGAEPVPKSKPKKKDHGQTGEGPTTSLLHGKIVEEPIRRSTRSSSTLSEGEASLPVVKKPVERCNLDKSEKRTSGHDLKRPESTVLAVTKAVSEPARRSTRGSSTLSQEKTSVLSHGESVEGYEVAGKRRSQKQANDRGSKRGGSNISLLDANIVAEPVRRSTRHSSNLMEEGASEPVVGKSVKGGELARKGKSQNQAKDHDSARGGATASPVIGKSVKQGDAVKKGKSQKQDKGHAPDREVSIASVSDNEAVVEPTKRMIRGSSKILKDVSQSPATRKSGDDGVASEKSKAGKRRRDHSLERGGLTASLPDSRAIITPIRGSTRSSSKLKGDDTSLRAGGNLGGHTDTGRKDNLGKQPMEHILEQGDSTTSLLDNVAVTKSTRRSTRSSLKVGADSEGPKSPCSPHPANKAVTTSARRSSHRSSKGPADSEVLKSPCSLQPDNEAATTPAIRSTCHSLEAPADSEVLKNQCSLQPDSEALTTPARRSAHHLGKAGSEILESPLSQYPDNEAVTKIPPDSEASMNPLCGDNEVFTMSARRSAFHSSNVPVDSEAPMSSCFPHIDNEAVTSPARGSACHLSKVSTESEVLKHPSSPYLASTLLEDILENSHVEAKTSRKEQTNVLQSINVPGREVDMNQTSTGPHILEEHDVLTGSGVNTSKLHGGTDLAREILVPSPSNVALAEVRDDADAKIGSEMRQSPVHVTLEEIENDTLVVGTQRELDVVSPSLHDIEGCSSLMEVTDKDRGGSPLSIIEGSSEVQENFTGKFKGSNVDGTVDAKETLESYGDDRDGASAQLEPSDIVLAEFTNDVDAKIASEMGQSPVSVPLEKIENDSSLRGLDEVSLSSHAIEGCSSFMEVINKDRGESPFKMIDGSSEVQEDFLGKPQCSNVDSTVNGQGTLESYREDIDEALAQVEAATSIIEASSRTFVGAINVDCLASMESQSVVNPPESLKSSEELRTMLEADPDHEDALVTHATASRSPGKGLERRSLTADPGASPEVASEEHNSNPRICAATEVGLQGDRTTYADIPALVGKSSKDPLPISHTDNSTVGDPEEPELKEEVEVPRDNLMAGSGAHNISDLMTSNMEACPESFCDISIEEFDSRVKAHPASKDHMKEGNEATNTASPPASCKFIGVPPTLLATPYNELCQKIDVTESDLHTHTMSRASGIHRKTLEVSMTSESDAGSSMKIQRIFGDEMESCKLDSGTMLNAESTPEECDAEEKIEDFIDVRDSESCIGSEIIKEMWISSTSPAKMNVCAETERDENCAEKDGDELRPYSPREDPTSVMYSVNDIKAQGSLLSPKETVDSAGTLCSHGDAEQSDFAQCVYDKYPADVDGKRDSFDDEFCENSSKHLLSPGASMKSEGLLYDLPVASKDKESSPSKITVTFSEVVEGNSSVANENYIRMLDASDKLVEQQENQERLLDVNEDYKGISALTVGNRSPSDAVLFEGCSEARDSSTFPVSVIPGEEMLPRTDTPATLGYESSANKGQSQEFSCVGDGEGVRHLLDQQGVALELSLGVESTYMSPKSAPTGQKALGQLNEDADIILETVHTAKELAGDDHEKSLELDAIDEDALENTGSLEGMACVECKDGAVTRKADGIGWSALDHFDEVCEKQNEAFLLPEIKDLSGELHAGDVASHSASDNSASASGDGRVLPLDNIALPTDIGNVQSLPQRDLVLSDEGQSIKDDTSNASTEEENLNGKESLCSVSSIQFAHQKEGQDSDMLKKKAFSAGSIRPVASPGTSPADSPNFGDNLNEESDGGKNISLRLPCNVRKEYDNQISSLAIFGESKQEDGEYKQEETTQDSPVEIESILKAREKDILPSTSESKHPVSCDTLGSECGSEDAYNVNNDNEAVLEESPDYKSIIISTKIAGAGHGSSHDVSMFISRGAQDSGVMGISENNEASHAGDHSLIGLEKLVDLSNRECLATVVTASSSQVQTRSEQSNTYKALRFAERSKDQEERVQETSGASECTRDDKFAVLEITKVEGSATVMSKSEKLEGSQIVTDAKLEELIATDAADISATNATDQVVSWDCTKTTGTERRPIGNDLEHSEFGATCTTQHASVSLDTGVDSSAAVRESMASKDEIMVTEAEEYFDDFCWSFADSVDVGSSLPKVPEVDSQFPMESTPGNSADHSSKSGKDVNDDENRRTDIKQMEDRKECDESAPMQLVKNSDAYSVIDDVLRNKENMVGLKMDGMRKHNEKSAISSSSRRPLESMRRTESDH